MPFIPDDVMDISLEWLDAYCSRDFTKRQTQIMALLLTLTLRQGGIYCYIPKLSDFEQCGVSRTKIKAELKKLVDLQVIFWNREENIFYINPNTKEWKAQPFKKFKDNKYQALIDVNVPTPTARESSTEGGLKVGREKEIQEPS